MTSQPRIFTPVVAEVVDDVFVVDCFAAFFFVIVEKRDDYRREWVRKGVQREGASVNNPWKLKNFSILTDLAGFLTPISP
jgi:hypothetical protein